MRLSWVFLFLISIAFNLINISQALEVILNPYEGLPTEFNYPQVYDYTEDNEESCDCDCQHYNQEDTGFFYDSFSQ